MKHPAGKQQAQHQEEKTAVTFRHWLCSKHILSKNSFTSWAFLHSWRLFRASLWCSVGILSLKDLFWILKAWFRDGEECAAESGGGCVGAARGEPAGGEAEQLSLQDIVLGATNGGSDIFYHHASTLTLCITCHGRTFIICVWIKPGISGLKDTNKFCVCKHEGTASSMLA